MKMVFVRQERILSIHEADKEYTHHVEHRHEQRRESDKEIWETIFYRWHFCRLARADKQITKNETKYKTSRVAHEQLCLMVHLSIHVKVPERHKAANGNYGDNCVEQVSAYPIDNHKYQQREHT